MPAPARPIAVSNEFTGLITNMDPRDLPPGAAEEQLNATCVVMGELRVRMGIREVTFDEEQ